MIKGLKGILRPNKLGCLDVCEHGLTILVYLAGHWYVVVVKEDLKRIYDTSIINSENVLKLISDNSQSENN